MSLRSYSRAYPPSGVDLPDFPCQSGASSCKCLMREGLASPGTACALRPRGNSAVSQSLSRYMPCRRYTHAHAHARSGRAHACGHEKQASLCAFSSDEWPRLPINYCGISYTYLSGQSYLNSCDLHFVIRICVTRLDLIRVANQGVPSSSGLCPAA